VESHGAEVEEEVDNVRVTELVKSSIGVECETHEQDKWCIEEDQSSLCNMCIICES